MRLRLGDGNFRRMPSVDDGRDWRADLFEHAASTTARRVRKRRKRTPQMEDFAAGGRYYHRRARIA
jgi:hypothetical protein